MRHEHELLTRYLDGDLPREALPPELQAEADAFQRAFDGLKRERIAAPPWVRTAVMSRVRAAPRAKWRELLDWLLTPRLVRVTPATVALVLAAGIAVAAALRYRVAAPPAVASRVQGDLVKTRFVFLAPGASSVAVTGDFVGWTPKGVPLQRDPSGRGIWVGVLRLEPGVHQYEFVIDGRRWRPDPNAPEVDNGFGEKNSVLVVPQVQD